MLGTFEMAETFADAAATCTAAGARLYSAPKPRADVVADCTGTGLQEPLYAITANSAGFDLPGMLLESKTLEQRRMIGAAGGRSGVDG